MSKSKKQDAPPPRPEAAPPSLKRLTTAKKQDAPPPRPEAAPLPRKRLTTAQRKAGEAIVTALHGMANEGGPSAFALAQEHLYLPYLDGKRSNRVLLIDGGRGTGKSTLMLTLLKAYGQLVLRQEPSEKFKDMDDRIIPIGIVDLQPLPPQTNLALHITGYLKRILEAVDPPNAVTAENAPPLWDEQALGPLREKWHRLMKLLATWDESLEARLGRPDINAYVVDTIEEELERGQLPERFREAVDVLVEGYARRFRWSRSKKPLFLLTIDDADMNPRLSIKLLELLRKLWHPRLAFLVAGDSNLFLLRLREELYARASMEAKEQEHYRKLAEDTYAKDIPSSARFLLDSLTSKERVKRIREIRKLLKQYTVEVHPPEIPRDYPESPPTLRDYLLQNEQSAELFPERLREVDELTARLRKVEIKVDEGAPSSAAFRVIKWLWDQTVKGHAGKEQQQRQYLTEMMKSSRVDGRLRLDTQRIRLRSELEPVAKIELLGSGNTITLHDLNRFKAFATFDRLPLESALGPQQLSEPVTACWLLATDVMADFVQGSRLEEAATAFDEGAAHFVVASWRDANSNTILTVPWMLPSWIAPVDYVLFAQCWRALLDGSPTQRTEGAGLLARQFLWLATQIAKHRGVTNEKEKWWERVPPDWPSIVEEIAGLAESLDVASPRQQLNARWAMEEVVLIAAPESCLPIEEARSFLEALTKRLSSVLSAGRIQERRLARLTQSNRINSDREDPIETIDQSSRKHPFVEVWKRSIAQQERRSDTTDLWSSIYNLEVPHLKPIMRRSNTLSHYGNNLRQHALGNLPKALSAVARLEIDRYRRISESTSVFLIGLWKVFSERMARPEVKDWFSLHRTRIIASEEASGFGEKLRESILNGREGDVQAITIDAVRTLGIERFAPVQRVSELPAPMEALFRIIFDYVQDQDDASVIQAGSLELALWPIVSTQMQSDSTHSFQVWPVVRWPSLKEFEDFISGWSDTVQALNAWLELDKAQHKPYIVDSLALSYLGIVENSRSRSGGSPYFESNATEAKFSEVLKSLVGASKTQGGRRDQLFSRWLKSLPLMGTPEAALSDPIAQIFIDHASTVGVDKPALRELRRERTRADGVPAGDVEALLERIDQSFPAHPWVQTVEARDPSDGGEPSSKKPRS